MALRIRKDGAVVCAAMTFEKEGDTYLDDGIHYALARYYHSELSPVGPHDEEWAYIYGHCLQTDEDPRCRLWGG